MEDDLNLALAESLNEADEPPSFLADLNLALAESLKEAERLAHEVENSVACAQNATVAAASCGTALNEQEVVLKVPRCLRLSFALLELESRALVFLSAWIKVPHDDVFPSTFCVALLIVDVVAKVHDMLDACLAFVREADFDMALLAIEESYQKIKADVSLLTLRVVDVMVAYEHTLEENAILVAFKYVQNAQTCLFFLRSTMRIICRICNSHPDVAIGRVEQVISLLRTKNSEEKSVI